MMWLRSIAFVLVMMLSLSATARAATSISEVLKRVEQSSDPMPKDGHFSGDVAENIKSRTVQLLTPNEKMLLGLDQDAFAFANYRDHGHFYIATIPGLHVDAQGLPTAAAPVIHEVHLIGDHWEEKTNPDLAEAEVHTYLRFLFRDGQGVKLVYDQSRGEVVPTTIAPIASAVLSIEAIRPSQQPNADFLPYSLIFDFALGHLFYSSYDRSQGEESDTGRIIEDQVLHLTSAKSLVPGIERAHEALLYNAIRASNDFGRSTTYNVVLNNCTNRLFDLVDRSIDHGFRKNVFIENVKLATDINVARGIEALKKLALSKNIELPPEVESQLNQASAQYLTKELVDGAAKSGNPRQYFTWLPIFVKAHFTARDLLVNSPN